MDCKQTKPKQNKTNKKIQHRHTIDNKVNKTKIPPSTHACTYTLWNISMVMKATLNTTYLNTSLMAWRESNRQR